MQVPIREFKSHFPLEMFTYKHAGEIRPCPVFQCCWCVYNIERAGSKKLE